MEGDRLGLAGVAPGGMEEVCGRGGGGVPDRRESE